LGHQLNTSHDVDRKYAKVNNYIFLARLLAWYFDAAEFPILAKFYGSKCFGVGDDGFKTTILFQKKKRWHNHARHTHTHRFLLFSI